MKMNQNEAEALARICLKGEYFPKNPSELEGLIGKTIALTLLTVNTWINNPNVKTVKILAGLEKYADNIRQKELEDELNGETKH
jgi:hypothetical protein